MKTETKTNYEAVSYYFDAVLTTLNYNVKDCLKSAGKSADPDCALQKFKLELMLNTIAEARDYAKKQHNYE